MSTCQHKAPTVVKTTQRSPKKLPQRPKQLPAAFRDDLEITEKTKVLQYILLFGVFKMQWRTFWIPRTTEYIVGPPKLILGGPNVTPGTRMLVFHWFYNVF